VSITFTAAFTQESSGRHRAKRHGNFSDGTELINAMASLAPQEAAGYAMARSEMPSGKATSMQEPDPASGSKEKAAR